MNKLIPLYPVNKRLECFSAITITVFTLIYKATMSACSKYTHITQGDNREGSILSETPCKLIEVNKQYINSLFHNKKQEQNVITFNNKKLIKFS